MYLSAFRVTLFVLAALLFPGLGRALAAPAQESPSSGSLRFQTAYLAPASFDQGGGKVALARFATTVSYGKFSFSYARREYFWEDQARLPFGNGHDHPWDAFTTLRLNFHHQGKLDGRWVYFVIGGVHSAFEQQMGNSMGAMAGAWLTYLYSPIWQFSAGAVGRLHKARSLVLPIVGLRWNMASPQGWRAVLGYPRTQVAYRFNRLWSLAWNLVGFDLNLYRLSDKSSVQPEGYLETRDLFSGLQVEYSPMPGLSLRAGVDYYFQRQFTVHDQGVRHEKEYDLDNSMGGRLSLTWRF